MRTSSSHHSGCSREEQVSEYIDGHLDGSSMRDVSAHIDECVHCSAQLQSLLLLKNVIRRVETPSTPTRPDFWMNAHRMARLSEPTERRILEPGTWGRLVNFTTASGAALALAAVFTGVAIFAPVAQVKHLPFFTVPLSSNENVTTIDVAPLMSAHVSYAEQQPLADDSQLSLILSEQSAPPAQYSVDTGVAALGSASAPDDSRN